MEIIIEVFNYVFIAILLGVSIAWLILIKSMKDSFRLTPFLEDFDEKQHSAPKVSVILPARNEEKYIEKCLKSLIEQDYNNYEIIAINDSSEDETKNIIKKYSEQTSKVIFVDAKPKPDGWMGKNWACMEG
ncbi:MAG: glycosyltransferase, partial [Nitrosopumilaceae archaeon]|nr:glycosyltransferase [Nitrosopumilaceae archaeon]